MLTRTAARRAAIAAACLTLPAPAIAQHRAALRSAIAPPAAPITGPGPADAVALGAMPDGRPSLVAPRRSAGARLGLQFLAASAGAVGGGLGTYFILRDVSDTRVKGDEGYTRSGNAGYLIGSFAGATLAAHAVGRGMGGTSPWWATSVGALIGTVPLMAFGVDEPFLPLYGIVFGWIPQAALAAGGFVMGDSR